MIKLKSGILLHQINQTMRIIFLARRPDDYLEVLLGFEEELLHELPKTGVHLEFLEIKLSIYTW